MVGNAIYTEDGDQIGTVKEIQGRFFKVDAPMKPDFWLSEDCIRSAGGARVTLTVDKDHLGDVKLSEPGPAMAPEGKNAIDLLKQMHVEAKGQLAQILATGNPQQAGDMWQKLQPVLKVHEQMEETYLYRPLQQQRGQGTELGSFEPEHHQEVANLESIIGEIGRLDPADTAWRMRVQQFKDTLERHIREEETEIFPKIQQVWTREQLDVAGRQMETMKRQAIG